MTQLCYYAQIAGPGDLANEAPKTPLLSKEVELLRSLIAACTPREFDYSRYQDGYNRKLCQLIDAKIAGKDIVAPAAAPTQVLDLVEALERSVAQRAAAGVLGPSQKYLLISN